ncbi:MAG: hypothetical protein K2W78_10185 [Xanthobacteraceae bacterium]|nr:hypothetical protein [Xanthobacteraceae bacterium]
MARLDRRANGWVRHNGEAMKQNLVHQAKETVNVRFRNSQLIVDEKRRIFPEFLHNQMQS